MRTIALMLLLVAPVAVAEEEVIDPLVINIHGLNEAELAQYGRLEREIACAFEDPIDLMDVTISLSRDLSANISDRKARSWLQRDLSTAAFAAAADPLELAASLLGARQEELRDLAYDHLVNSDAWTASETVRGELLRLLDDPCNSVAERSSIVSLFTFHGLAEAVRERAVVLAGDHADPDLAHAVAHAMLISDGYEERANKAFAGFASDVRALREEAAAALPCSDTPDDALRLLLDVAKDESEPALVRGRAVAALADWCTEDDPRRVAAVLELSQRQFWFDGAPGNHSLVHSLALLIRPLGDADTALTRARLDALRTEIRILPEIEQEHLGALLEHATPRADPSPSP